MGGLKERRELMNFLPLKKGDLLERKGLFEKGLSLTGDLRYFIYNDF